MGETNGVYFAYKAFNHFLGADRVMYKVGKKVTFEGSNPTLGGEAYLDPKKVLEVYGGGGTRYGLVEASDIRSRSRTTTRIVAGAITLVKELTPQELAELSVKESV